MMFKKIMVISVIFVLLFTISAACASDVDIDEDELDTVDMGFYFNDYADTNLSKDFSSSDLGNLDDSNTVVSSGDSIASNSASSTIDSASSRNNKTESQVTVPIKKSKTKIKVAKNKKGYMTTSNFIKARLLDSKGKAVKNKKVLFTIGKKSYSAKTDSKGVAKIRTPYKKGIFNVKFRFSGDKTYSASSANAKLNINRMITLLKAPKVTVYVTRKAILKVKLTNAYGKALAKKRVYVKVSGKTYKITTNRFGIANLKLKKAVGTYNCRVNFKANKKFHGSSLDTKVIFKKIPTSIIAPSVNFKSTDYANLKISLKDKFGNALKNKSITVNVTDLNKVFKVKTNSKGVASFKFNGEMSYKLVLKYAGGVNYNPSSVKSKLNINAVKVKFEDIAGASELVVEYVNKTHELPSTVEYNGHVFTITQFSYLAVRALKNICNNNTADVVLISVPEDYSSSGEIFDSVYKKDFLQIAETILDSSYNFKNKDYINYSVYKVPFNVYTLSIAKMINFYCGNERLPNYSLMSTIDFINRPPSNNLTFYLTSDYLYPNTEENKVPCFEMLKSLRDTLNSMGYDAYIVGMGPNIHNVAYTYGCQGNDSVLLCCFSGVDVGVIESMAGELDFGIVENYDGAHFLGLWYTKPFGASSDIHGYIPRAHDADYGWPLDDAAAYMEEHNISYIQVGTVEDACQALLNGDMGGPKLLPTNNLIADKEDA